MQKERERVDALAQGLSMTRSALYANEAHARKVEDEAAELRQAAAAVRRRFANPHRTGAIGRRGWNRIS
jgi:hypothetical protein